MKKVMYLGTVLVLFIACDQRYTQNSSEINLVKELIADYNNGNYEIGVYADTAKIYFNTKDNPISPSQWAKEGKEGDAIYSSRGFLDENQEYQMVITDKGETWVDCWLDWKGTLAANGKEFNIPIQLSYQFVDGKVVRTVGTWDPSEIVLEMQALEARNNLPPDENAGIVNGMYNSFGEGDVEAVLAKLDANVVWLEAEGNPWADGNPYLGPDAVLEGVFKRVGDEYEYFELADLQLHEMANDKVLATLRYNAKRKDNGVEMDVQAAHLWTLSNGKVIGFQQYADTRQLTEAANQ